MIEGVNNPQNKDRIAIIAVGYNRKKSLTRLLESLNNANYPSNDIPLVISIDASGDQDLYDYVKSYEWNHGTKYLNIQQERLGLKNHILQCGDLTQYFKAVALFEDDLWVSPFFYSYLTAAVDKYGDDERICQIALYRNESLGGSGFYFDTLHDGTDCFLWKDVCTWGECWTKQMWEGFRQWNESHDETYVNSVDMPESFKQWTRAWSKYYIAYGIDKHKYIVFPHESLSTNFNDAGGEHGGGNTTVQVNVLHGERNYHFNEVDKMIRYDIYTNNESLYDWVPEKYHNHTCLDLYGLRSDYQGKRYVLTMMKLPFEVVEQWGLTMRPVELNVLYRIPGDGIRLYDTSIVGKIHGNGFLKEVVPYMLRGFYPKLLLGYVNSFYSEVIKKKFRIK